MSVVSGGLQSGGGAAVLLLPNATGTTLTLSSSLTVGAGTAAAPTINFTGDTTTGFYRQAAGTVGFAASGADGLRFGANLIQGSGGNVSLTLNIGTAWIGSYSTNSILMDGTHFAWRPGGTELGGWTSAGTLRTGAATILDSSGTPGSATLNGPRGRSSFDNAAGTTITITNNAVTTNSVVMAILETATDATLLYIRGVTPGAGSFTVTVNAAATGTVIFRWFVVQ